MRNGLVPFLLLGGCEEAWLPMEPSRVCDDVRYAIASRTFECTGDETLALRRSDAFGDGYSCLVETIDEPIDRYYHCPVTVEDTRCPDVKAFGDDLDRWLAQSPACAAILAHADGSPVPGGEEP
jgi:hypothetical protein